MPLQPNWWGLSKAHQQTLSALADNGDADAAEGAYFASPTLEAAPVGVWSAPYVEGPKRPPPRYEHASAVIGSQLFVFGGNCGGSCACFLGYACQKLSACIKLPFTHGTKKCKDMDINSVTIPARIAIIWRLLEYACRSAAYPWGTSYATAPK